MRFTQRPSAQPPWQANGTARVAPREGRGDLETGLRPVSLIPWGRVIPAKAGTYPTPAASARLYALRHI